MAEAGVVKFRIHAGYLKCYPWDDKLPLKVVISAPLPIVNFLAPIISLECVKLGISNLVWRLTLRSTSACIRLQPKDMCSWSCDLIKFLETTDILETESCDGRLIGNRMWPRILVLEFYYL